MYSQYSEAFQQYRQTQVQTAGPNQLILMLYYGALRCLDEAKQGIVKRRPEQAHRSLLKAQDIVNELMAALDLETGELAQNLYHLYDYMYSRLVEANTKKDEGIVTEIRGMLAELCNTWQEVLRQAGSSRDGGKRYDHRC